MLEKLAEKSHYCWLDGYSGYHQIPIAPEDQEKMMFAFHLGHLLTDACPLGHVILQPHSRDAWSIYFLNMWKTLSRYSWMILLFMIILLIHG